MNPISANGERPQPLIKKKPKPLKIFNDYYLLYEMTKEQIRFKGELIEEIIPLSL
jgi:hypothetical protein